MDIESLAITEEHGNGNGNGVGEADRDTGPTIRAPQTDVGGLPAVLESLLFAAGAPVSVVRLMEALEGPGRAEIVQALETLAATYEREGRGLRLVHVAGGYQLRTPPEHAPWVRRLLRERPPRLSRPMLETLAIVAYRQPCTRIEIEAVRGVDADAVLATLTDRRLVRILGRKEAPGRPLLYGTTKDFLEVFGLPDLTSLPPLRDVSEGGAELLAAQVAQAESETPASADEASEGNET